MGILLTITGIALPIPKYVADISVHTDLILDTQLIARV